MSEPKTLGNFSEKQLKYIQFLARNSTTKSGEKRTKEQFAEAIGIHWTTLYDWQRLPGFAQALFEETLKFNAKHLPAIVQAQIAAAGKKGKGGDTQAFMAIMRQYELLKSDKVDHTTNGKDLPAPIMGGGSNNG
jgi:hypothetical protein